MFPRYPNITLLKTKTHKQTEKQGRLRFFGNKKGPTKGNPCLDLTFPQGHKRFLRKADNGLESLIFSEVTQEKQQQGSFKEATGVQRNGSRGTGTLPAFPCQQKLMSWRLKCPLSRSFPASSVLPAMQETPVRFLGREDLLEKG